MQDFAPNVICGEVHPQSWRLYAEIGEPYGILGETQEEYPRLVFPYCERHGVKFVPVNWFEEDVFDAGPFDQFVIEAHYRLEQELAQWKRQQRPTWNHDRIPFNSSECDAVMQDLYAWLQEIHPAVQNIQWNAPAP